MRITRFPALSAERFSGCISAFVDSLSGELNAATLALRRLRGQPKAAAFAYEMDLDRHRYGTLIVLDRWKALLEAFGPHLELPRGLRVVERGEGRVLGAVEILDRANALLDAAPAYSAETVEACALAWQSALAVFDEERADAARTAALGPMLSEEYREARRIFLEDLAAR